MFRKKKFPTEIDFFEVGKTLFVKSLVVEEKYNPEAWSLCKFLEKPNSGIEDIFILNKIDFTRALRLYFLNKVFKGIQFLPQFSSILEQIQAGIKDGVFVTYKEKLGPRGTKNQREAKLEKEIYDHLGEYFDKEFRFRPAWR